MNEEKLDELMGRAQAMGYNSSASGLWAEASTLAHDLGKHTEEAYSLLSLVTAYHSQSKVPQILAPFVKARALYREHPEAFTEPVLELYAWCYRHAYGAMSNIPEVPVHNLEELLVDAHEFYKTIGDSRRALFQRDYDLARLQGDDAAAEEAHNNWLNAEVTMLSNCPACDPEVEVSYLIDSGEYEKAIALGERSIDSGEMTCASQPYSMMTTLMGAYLKEGQEEKAWNTHLRVYRHLQSGPARTWMLPAHLRLLAKLGANGNAQAARRGIELFVRHLPWWMDSEDQIFLLEIAKASAMVCAISDPDQILPVTLPGGQLPWQPPRTIESPTVAAAFDWCYEVARGIAKRFDKRPGLNNPQAVADLDEAIADVRSAVAAHGGPGSAARAGESADEEDFLFDVSGLITELENEANAGVPNTNARVYPSLASVRGKYSHDLSIEELLECYRESGTVPSTYLELALDKGLDPHDAAAMVDNTPDTQRPLASAETQLAAENYAEAAKEFEEFLRSDVDAMADPVASRISALCGLGAAQAGLGNNTEAVELLREAINTAAAFGLKGMQLEATFALVQVLGAQGRTDEIGSVCATALIVAEKLTHAPARDELITALRIHYFEALVAEEDLLEAAHQAVEIAKNQAGTSTMVHFLTEAGIHYFASREFDAFHQQMTAALTMLEEEPVSMDELKVRTWYAAGISRQPWPLSNEEIAHMRELFSEGEKRAGQFPDSFVANAWIAEYRCNLARCLAMAERIEEANTAVNDAVLLMNTYRAPEELVMLLIEATQWNAEVGNPRATDYLYQAQEIANTHNVQDPELRNTIQQLIIQLGR